MNSLKCIATIDIKFDEAGLLEAAQGLHIPIRFFTREQLSEIDSPNPSPIVNHHIGVPSVCEAAAVLASEKGELIVPKQISPNVTLAIARINFCCRIRTRRSGLFIRKGLRMFRKPLTRLPDTRCILT